MVKFENGYFDPLTRGSDRPHSINDVLLCSGCGAINILFQYYLLYGGGAVAFFDYIGYSNPIAVSDTQKMIMMILFIEAQLQMDLRCVFIFHTALFSGWSAAFVHLGVRIPMYTLLSLTAYMGYGLLPPYWYGIGFCGMVFFQLAEAKGDYDLTLFVSKKKTGLTNDKAVCTEKSWSLCRHPNHLGFLQYWPFHALMATSNPWTVLFVYSFLHFWIICVGIPSNEKHMLEKYGEEYSEYKSNVPMLYPYWYSKPKTR